MMRSHGERARDLGLDIFDLAPVGVSVTRGRDHRLVYTNAAHDVVVGERPLARPLGRSYGGMSASAAHSVLYDQVVATGEPVYVHEAYTGGPFVEDGHERALSFSLSPIEFDDGECGVLFVGIDVTEQAAAVRKVHTLSEERRRALQRFESLVAATAQVVWVTSPLGDAVQPSPGWEELTGQRWEEFRGQGWLEALHPEDREQAMESWRRALKEVPPLWQNTFRLRMKDGVYRHFLARGAPVREDDEVIEWVGTCTDVEREWQENRRQSFLDRAGAATAGMVRVEEILDALCNVIVPDLADGCMVYLLPDSLGNPGPATPVLLDRVAAATRRGLPSVAVPSQAWVAPFSGFAQAVRRRRPVYTTFTPGTPPPDIASHDVEAWLTGARINSVVLLPLVVDGDVAAVMAASVGGDRRPISAADVEMMGQILDHAHAPLSNALEFRRAQRVALALQNSLLVEPPRVPGLRIVARYRPSPEAAEVGGDWYDSFILPDGAPMLTIGDVAGHDLPAAVTMSQLRNMLRGLAVDRQEPPGGVLRRLNIAMETLCREDTATCILARIEGRGERDWRFHYSVAGHPPPLLVSRDGRSRYLEGARNTLLGVMADAPRTSAVEHLEPHSTLLLYTDGLIEQPGESLDLGMARLREHAAPLAGESPDRFCDELLAALAVGSKDDVALIALRVER